MNWRYLPSMQASAAFFFFLLSLVGTSSMDFKISKVFEVSGNEFILIHRKLTWIESHYVCKTFKGYLVEIISPFTVIQVSRILSQHNLDEDDVWVGGRLNQGQWEWVDSGTKIPAPNNSFPPWLQWPSVSENKGCLVVTMAQNCVLGMRPLRCDKNRLAICYMDMSRISGRRSPFHAPEPKVIEKVSQQSTTFLLHAASFSYYMAESYCKKNDMELATLRDALDVKTASRAVARNDLVFPYLWIKEVTSLTRRMNDSLCPVVTESEYEESNLPITFFDCNAKYGFICSSENTEHPGEYFSSCGDKTLILLPGLYSWDDGNMECLERGHQIAAPDTEACFNAFIDLMAEPDEEITQAWVGGRLQNGTWVWVPNGGPILQEGGFLYPWCNNDPNPYRPCLSISRSNKFHPIMLGAPCGLTSSVLCEFYSEPSEPDTSTVSFKTTSETVNTPVTEMSRTRDNAYVPHYCLPNYLPLTNGKWICKMFSEESLCVILCDLRYFVKGPPAWYCNATRWFLKDNDVEPVRPSCLALEHSFTDLRLVMERLYNSSPSSILFLIDDSKSVNRVEYKRAMYFADCVVRGYPLRSDFSAGLIVFSSTSQVMIEINTTETCKFIRKLPYDESRRLKALTHYDEALNATVYHLAQHNKNNTLIYGLSNGGSYNKSLEKIRRAKNTIVTITIVRKEGRYMRDYSASYSLSSAYEGLSGRLFFNIRNYKDLTEMGALIRNSSGHEVAQPCHWIGEEEFGGVKEVDD